MRITPFPLHTAQQDIYTDQLIDITSSQYNIGGYLKLKGTLNTQILHEVVASAPKVFDAFRIRFNLQESAPVCYFDEDYEKSNMADMDFSGHTNPSEAAICWMQERFNTAFQLESNNPLFEQCLLKISNEEHWFFGRYHHLMADGYGFVVWIQYMAQKYQSLIAQDGREFKYPSYRQEIITANKNLHSPDYETDAAYWKEKIHTKPEKLLQKKYYKNSKDRRSITYILNLTSEQRTQLENLQHLTKSGLQQLTIAALLIYLGKTSEQAEFIVGIPVHKRSSKHLRSTMGTFTGILPFKGVYQPGQKVTDFLKEIAASQRIDYRHQNYLVGDLTRHLKINAAEGYLSDIIINYEPLNFDLDFGKDIQASILRLTNEDERNPLKIVWRDYNTLQPLQLHIHFSNEYFNGEEIELLAQRIIFILEQFTAHLEDAVENIPVLPEAEVNLLHRFNNTEITYPFNKTITDVFEEQVLKTPNLEAVAFGQEHLTYAAINERANQLAHYLQSQGVTAETLVAICIERSVEMIIGILGILKAGGAYVPIDPDYPADRIAYILEDSSVKMILTGKDARLELVATDIHIIELTKESESISSFSVDKVQAVVAPHHLAYVIYTSGSTGKPKGVMIEHRGVVNLAFSQAEALRLQPGMKTLQFSSVGFDASCYEIFNTLLSGGCLVLCTKEDILTADGLKKVINTQQVELAVLPPSYQQIIVANLGTIQTIVSAGEPLNEALGRQIQSKGVRLINAYGPTENTVCVSLSDDPIRDDHTIVIGKPISNMQVYVLDRENRLLPVGSAGEICTGGIQVARGYLNRPALTEEKFIKHPFSNDPNARLYKTGDLGRWLPDGNLVYLGRIDDQVKIRGYRIEPGEIENVLIQSGLVKQCVVLAVGDAEGSKRLVGYVVPEGVFDKGVITTYLYEKLPEYMVPALWVEVESFAVTASGKIDRKALPDINTTGATADAFAAPRNAFEQQLTEIWQELLEIEKIGINDNFFELGGDSIITIQLVSRARQLGYGLDVADVFNCQTIAGLSKLITEKIDNSKVSVEQEMLTGDCGLLPIQQWYLQKEHTHVSHYNQSVIVSIDKAVTEPVLRAAFEQITAHHDALRFGYAQQNGTWHQAYGTAQAAIITEDIRLEPATSSEILIEKIAAAHQYQLNITTGELVRIVWIQTSEADENNRLLMVIHHLAVDGVSWRILIEDIELLINGLIGGQKSVLPAKTGSCRQWYDALTSYGNSRRLLSQTAYWKQVASNYSPLPADTAFTGEVRLGDTRTHTVQLTREQTLRLLQEVPRVYHTGINDLLLAALAKTVCEWSKEDKTVIGLEGHGREPVEDGIDTSRTVGWFTTLFPVLLRADGDKKIEDWIKTVKEHLHQVPDRGIGYGVLKYLNKETTLQGKEPWDMVFNYLGQLDNVVQGGKWLKAANQSGSASVSEEHIVQEKLSVNSMVQEGALVITWSYSSKHYHEETIPGLAQKYLSNLQLIIDHCLQAEKSLVTHTPSDFGLGAAISYQELDAFLNGKDSEKSRWESIQSLYGLSGLQRGILFHGLYDRGVAGTYISQFSCDLANVDADTFRKSWEAVMAKHHVLRTAFYYDAFKIPVQCVCREANLPIALLDYTGMNGEEQATAIAQYEKADRLLGFDFKVAPLMRFALIRLQANQCRMLWTWHHILLDGWSLPILIQEFLSNYDALIQGKKITVQADNSYEKFIRYIERGDKEAEQEYWQQYLEPLKERTQLPFIEINPEKDQRFGQNKLIFLTINKAESAGIKNFAQSHHLTINTVMQGVLALLLHTYTGNSDIVYGVTVAGRPDTLEGVENSVGMYINTLPLYSHIQKEDEVTAWLHRLQSEQLASRQFQHTPLFDIQASGTISGDLFDTLLVFENYPVSKLLSIRQWNLEIKNYRVHDQSNFPLTIAVNDADEIFIQFSYNSGIIEDAYIEKLRSHFHQVLLQITGNINARLADINLLTPADERQLLIDFNNTTTLYPKEKSIADLFEVQVAATPEAVAVIFEDEQLTYRQLNERANQLANYLATKGVKEGSLVPVCMERSIHLIVAILGILKARGAFVPIDPEYPQERIDYILNDTNAAVAITSSAGKEKLLWNADVELIDVDEDQLMISRYPVNNLVTRATPDTLAYIIYTSGSTGKPKGVMVPHKGNVNMSLDQVRQFNITAADRVLQFASISFDASVSEIFMAFYAGASLVLMRKNKIQDGANFASNLKSAGVTVVTLPPVYLRALQADDLKFLRVIITAGEAADVKIAAYLSNDVDYYNAYGPTECSVCVSIYKVQPGDVNRSRIPIGKPIANTNVFILDEDLKLVPVGVQGNLYVSGAGLANGYLHLPELTAEKFIISPFDSHTTLYKTGDMGRWLPDGNIEFSGRQDDQVKLRGYRVELGEIEHTLAKHKDVEKAVAVINEAKEDKQLVIYFQPKDKIRLWPSVAEFYVYDDLLYKTMAGDEARNAKYRNALRKVVKDKVILEIGPGFEAILSRICIEEGAKKVYAVELLEDSYLKAKQTVEDLGLSDKIIVIHDDITKVQLPELADFCVSEIVGAIGGAEGSATLINASRHLLKDPSCMIPVRSTTKIAAITLPANEFDCGFEELGAYYTSKIFEQAGHKFDLRVYLSSFPTRNIISNKEIFEDLDYTSELLPEDEHDVSLKIEQDSVLHGFIVWLNLYCDEDELIDTLEGKYTWLPVYFPAFFNGEKVAAGDYIQAKVSRKLSSNQLNPDFYISGTLVRKDQPALPFTYESLYCSDTYQGNEFYRKIFENDEIKLAGKVNKEELKNFLKAQLPEYMVPSLFIEVEHFPLTVSGKLDKKALPNPDAEELLVDQYVAPRTQIENDLAAIWKEVLEVEQVGIHDDFFELGGHSLLAIRLISVIREELNIEVAIANIFDHPTIEALANALENKTASTILPFIELQTRPDDIPLSFGQERLWFIHQLEGSVEYHSPAALRLTGQLSISALEQSLAYIIDRHEVLRTVFKEVNGQPYQYIKEKGDWHITIIDGSTYKANAGALRSYIAEFVSKPFDLSTDHMLRANLIRLSEEEHVLVVVIHHIAADAWSMPIIINELIELYQSFAEGRPAAMASLPLQYADYAIWQRNYLTADVLNEKINYWKNKLDGVQPLQLPADNKRAAVRSTTGNTVPFELNAALLNQLHKLSKQEGATLFMTLLAVFKVLLYRYSGQQDISVGTSIASRTQQEAAGLIGFFVNTLALRDQVTGEITFTELLQQVRTTTLEAYEHQEVPFEKVVETVVKERDAVNSPLFQVMLVLQNTPDVPDLKLGNLTISPEPYEVTTAKFDLTFFLAETPSGLQGSVVYSSDLFSQARIEQMITHFTVLVNAAVASPGNKIGTLKMLSAAEEDQSKGGFNISRISNIEDQTIVALFEKQVLRWPASAAVSFEGAEISYEELNERSNRLAHYLRLCGVKEDTLVPLFIDRGPDMITGILGILKAGGAYVPIDTGLPSERINFMLQDTAATVVVCSSESREKLPAFDTVIIETNNDVLDRQPKHNLATSPASHHLAYVIYTSGSTGQPKGVMVTHGNLTDYVQGLEERTGINSCNSFALVSNIATDLGNTVLYSSLVSGGTLHVFSREAVSDIEGLHDYFAEHQIDCVKIVPSHWKALMMDGQPLLPRRLLVFGGESLQAEQLAFIRQSKRRKCRVVNHYGPTETTVGKLLYEVNFNTAYTGTIPIGKPFCDSRIYVLSSDMSLCPVGVPGQLYIGGAGVARGYLNNEQLTGEKFIADPIDKTTGGLVYKTGDLVKYEPDGNILFLGRIDDQVKIRGYRVEPGEVERVLSQSGQVSSAVVLALDDKQGSKRLVAYVVADYFDREALNEYLQEKLPEYMIPSVMVELKTMPLTANGKVDRKALPDPEAATDIRDKQVAPQTAAELQMAAIWQEVLETEQVGIHDDFFELGGHSLLAIRLISAIRKSFNAEVTIGAVFDYPTIAGLLTQISKPTATVTLPAITAYPRPEHIPLSFSQERLWFIDKLDGSVQYHVPAVLRLKGELNIDALSYALQQIINRHEVLRTVIMEKDGRPFQFVKEKDKWELNRIDGRVYQHNPSALQEFIDETLQKSFDLSRDYMIRAHLITTGNTEYLLAINLHHIASDGWSRSVLVKELVALYQSYENSTGDILPDLTLQYVDYAIWQQTYLQGETLNNKLDYWKKQLDGVETLQLPTDFVRPTVQTINGAVQSFTLEDSIAKQVRTFSQEQGTTLYMTLLAVFNVLLHRYSGQEDICVGTAVAGRQQKDLEGLIGFFVNTLAIRNAVHSDVTFREFLRQVKNTTLDAYSNQEVPFEKVVDAVVKERDLSRNPVFQTTFIIQNTPEVPNLRFGNVELSIEYNEHITSKFDISFSITESDDELNGTVEYNSDLYRPGTIERMIGHFKELILSVLAAPDQKIGKLQMLTPPEEKHLLGIATTATTVLQNQSLIEKFSEQVAKTPDSIALIFEGKEVSYQELDTKSNQLANYLRSVGVKQQQLIPICIERCPGMIVGILGILKAGAAYVPIDLDYPAERVAFILEDSHAKIVLSSSSSRGKMAAGPGLTIIEIDSDWDTIGKQPEDLQVNDVAPEQGAYIIYTSGSTGKPKGVMVEHRSVVNLIHAQTNYFKVTPDERILQFSNYCFDASVEQIFLALLNGAKLVLYPEGLQYDTELFEQFLAEKKISHLHATPFFLENITPPATDYLKRIIAGGDKCRKELVDKWKDKCAFYNEYGPTETTVTAIEYQYAPGLHDSAVIPIGKPLENVSAYVLDKNRLLCPQGVPGELYIGGIQVARGYLNRPELTSEKFIPDSFGKEGDRLYRTGDLVRLLPDDNLEFLGRVDDQVKIHGYRIELGEIETVVNTLEPVENSCVAVKYHEGNGSRLVGYYIPKPSVVKEKEHELYLQQVDSWKAIHENEYVLAGEDKSSNPEFNILGWNDSFTRKPIAEAQMREWQEDFISVVMQEKPEYVLEIGSGTGLVYYPLADKIKKYIGTDFSQHSINQIREQINKGEKNYCPTELKVCAAHEIALDENEPVDTILLNSVVQYFPGGDYLGKVIEKSISLLKGKGRIIIGDVRDNRLLQAFKRRLLLQKLQDTVSVKEFNWAVEQELLQEEELCFAPEYFYDLQQLYPQITHIDVQWKQGTYVNELTMYRFTVVIYVGINKPVLQPDWQNWNSRHTRQAVIQQLTEHHNIVGVKDVPNPRLWKDKLLQQALSSSAVTNVEDMKVAIKTEDEDTIQVNELLRVAAANCYRCKLMLDEDSLKINILFSRNATDCFTGNMYREAGQPANSPKTNIPLFADISLLLQKDINVLLREKLPAYMIPSEWVALSKLPLTGNGKLDRKFLSEREEKIISNQLNYAPPRNKTEEKLAAIWEELLHLEKAGIYDNFFELGGHSLMAMRVIAAIRKELHQELTIKDLFFYPTIAGLASFLSSQSFESTIPGIGIQARSEFVPLSFSQERLWFIDSLSGSEQYHLPSIIKLAGRVDIAALKHTFQSILQRHQVLRTVILQKDGQGYQYLLDEKLWDMEIVDGRAYTSNREQLDCFLQEKTDLPFDLAKDFMLRAHLVYLNDDEHILLITIHHIAADAWSMAIIVSEVAALYGNAVHDKKVVLPPLPIQYADYAIWQRNYLQGTVLDKKLHYWKEKLTGVEPINLPTDYPRPPVWRNQGAISHFRINKKLSNAIQSLSRQQGTTLYMSLLAAFKILLHKYSGQQDICVGTSVANRTVTEAENLIGFFVNMLALRSNVQDALSFTDFLLQVKDTTLKAYEHQDVPFEKVVDAVVKERDMSKNPLIQVMFFMINTPEIPDLELGDMTLSVLESKHNKTHFDISFYIKETSTDLQCWVAYCTDLYQENTITQMVSNFQELLLNIVADPEQKIGNISILNQAAKHRILVDFNQTTSAYPADKSIIAIFEEQVAKTPDAVALVFEDKSLTYQQLNERSNQLAHFLRSQNVRAETLVPVAIKRSIEMIVGILGILKAGGAYVPLDMQYPEERLSYILHDISAEFILTDQRKASFSFREGLNTIDLINERDTIRSQPKENLVLVIQPSQLAYVMYTSGSTGTPKGVMATHQNVVSLVKEVDYVSFTNQDVLLSTGSSFFDATTFEYWGMLLNGGKLILCREDWLLENELLKKLISTQQVNKMWFTSTWFNQLVDADITIFEGLQTVVVGGEKLSEKHIEKMRLDYPSINIVNGYGPTENTTFSLTYNISEDEIEKSIPIGRPVNNRYAYVLDPQRNIVPVGVTGEIYLAGAGLTRGYLNNDTLTEQKFISNPFSTAANAKMYKTGDLGCWLPDGNIQFQGRVDDQVKIRGFRIEPGEIETVLGQQGSVKQCVILANEDQNGKKRLVAYVVPETTFDKELLVSYLNNKLPEYMVPAIWMELDALPVTSNGKVDKRALPRPDATTTITNAYEEPRTEPEKKLAEIWEDLLGVIKIGIHDNFFELGGDSIITIQVVSRLKNLGYSIQPKDIFIHQTISNLASAVSSRSEIVAEQGMLTGPVGMLPIQQWYFEREQPDVSHFNQAVFVQVNKAITGDVLLQAVKALMQHHDALRFTYRKTNGEWQQEYGQREKAITTVDLRNYLHLKSELISEIAEKHQKDLDIETGKLVEMVWMQTPESEEYNRLLIIIHHLAIDGVSWRILLQDLEQLLVTDAGNAKLPAKTKSSSYRQWFEALVAYGKTERLLRQYEYWQKTTEGYQPLPADKKFEAPLQLKDTTGLAAKLGINDTRNLIQEVPRVYHTEINDILLAALVKTITAWSSQDSVVIGLEGHGREHISDVMDVSQTVGWFTTLYPLQLHIKEAISTGDVIKTVKEQLRKVPDRGLGYGVIKYINKEKFVSGAQPWDIQFNYLGQLDNVLSESKWLAVAPEPVGNRRSREQIIHEKIAISAHILSGELIIAWNFSNRHFEEKTIRQLADNYITQLKLLIEHCMNLKKSGAVSTPSDYGLGSDISYQELDAFMEEEDSDNILSF